ncbi:hypothetical protein HZS_304, partial [Henneguya salminicola]
MTKKEFRNMYFDELKSCEKFPMNIIDININEISSSYVCKSIYIMDCNRLVIWLKIISKILISMNEFFGTSEEIKPFLDVLNFSFILHSQNYVVVRFVLSIYINLSIKMNRTFSYRAFTYIIPTIIRIYSKSGIVIKTAIELTFYHFFDLHRKYFIYQVFSSIAPSLLSDIYLTNVDKYLKLKEKDFCELIFSLNKTTKDVLDITGELISEIPLSKLGLTDIEDLNQEDNVEYCIRLAILGIINDSKSYKNITFLIILNELIPYQIEEIKNRRNLMEIKKYKTLMTRYFKTLMYYFDYVSENFGNTSSFSLSSKNIEKNNNQFKTVKMSDIYCVPLIKRLSEENDYSLQNKFLLPNILLFLISKIYKFIFDSETDWDMKESSDADIQCQQSFKLFLSTFCSVKSTLSITQLKGLNYFIENMFNILSSGNKKHRLLLEKTVDALISISKQILYRPNSINSKLWKVLANFLRSLSSTIKKNTSITVIQNLPELVRDLIDIVCFTQYGLSKNPNLLRPKIFSDVCIDMICSMIGKDRIGLSLSRIFLFSQKLEENKSFSIYESFLVYWMIPIILKLEGKTSSYNSSHLLYPDIEILIRFLITLMKSIANFRMISLNKILNTSVINRISYRKSIINKFLSTNIAPSKYISRLIFLALNICITLHLDYVSYLLLELSIMLKEYFLTSPDDSNLVELLKYALSINCPLKSYLQYQF